MTKDSHLPIFISEDICVSYYKNGLFGYGKLYAVLARANRVSVLVTYPALDQIEVLASHRKPFYINEKTGAPLFGEEAA